MVIVFPSILEDFPASDERATWHRIPPRPLFDPGQIWREGKRLWRKPKYIVDMLKISCTLDSRGVFASLAPPTSCPLFHFPCGRAQAGTLCALSLSGAPPPGAVTKLCMHLSSSRKRTASGAKGELLTAMPPTTAGHQLPPRANHGAAAVSSGRHL